MFNYYLVKSKGKYLNTDGKIKLTDKKSATYFDDEFSADYMGDMYCEEYEVEAVSYDK